MEQDRQEDTAAPRAADACAAMCPALARATLDVIGSRWAVPILVALNTWCRPLRYAELQRRIGSITAKELARQLRALEAAGLIARRVFPTVPPRVEYRLTELGGSIEPVVEALADWGARYRAATQHSDEPPLLSS